MTLANKITLVRALMAVVMFVCIIRGEFFAKLAALVIFILAAISDWVDGKIARRTQTTTIFGAIADPFVDKILVMGAFIAFLAVKPLNVPFWAVFLILARELTISTLRVLAAIKGKILSAERSGKFKTAVQFIAVLIILIILNFQSLAEIESSYSDMAKIVNFVVAQLPYALTVITAVVSWISGVSYIKNHWKLLSDTWSAPEKK
ncbi:MAG TPA: CDP-diacylglycerol--glycerol-3-phosphate 3-phosphatidyltransferase [Elusimicrobiales bacterium]|nr:CDP-diacylglycerol--glycerol-3-phosphate 3-phosphatidyltransferase [Elusimicrobiales bacterium]